MWKIALGFVAFAALSLFVLLKAGDGIDMGGEKHSGDVHAPEPVQATPAPPATPGTAR